MAGVTIRFSSITWAPFLYLALAALAPLQVGAQEVPAGRVSAEYAEHERLLTTLQSDAILDANMASVSRAAVRVILQGNGLMAETATAHPGFVEDLIKGLVPITSAWARESLRLVRPRQLELLRSTLTSEEAALLADFYASPLGQKVVIGTAQGTDYAASINPENIFDPLTGANIDADLKAGARRMAQTTALSSAEQLRLLALTAEPAFVKMSGIAPRMTELMAEVENRPMPPETQAQMAQAMLDTLADYGVMPEG